MKVSFFLRINGGSNLYFNSMTPEIEVFRLLKINKLTH